MWGKGPLELQKILCSQLGVVLGEEGGTVGKERKDKVA